LWKWRCWFSCCWLICHFRGWILNTFDINLATKLFKSFQNIINSCFICFVPKLKMILNLITLLTLDLERDYVCLTASFEKINRRDWLCRSLNLQIIEHRNGTIYLSFIFKLKTLQVESLRRWSWLAWSHRFNIVFTCARQIFHGKTLFLRRFF
jgi:hypothetical protein